MEKQFRFPGTKSFSFEEASIFFGRDADIANLCTSVTVNPTTVLFGKSGTGKSSLIQAGMIPALQKRNSEEDQPQPYLTLNIMPKPYDVKEKDILNDKILSLIKAIVGNGSNFLRLSEPQNEGFLWYILKQYQYQLLQEKKDQVLLLVFDQAEELFTYPDSQIDKFVNELRPVIGQFVPDSIQKIIGGQKSLNTNINSTLYSPLPVKFIFSIRSDKLHLITRLKKASPHILQNSYELLPLRKKEAFECMDGPSQHNGENFSSRKFKITDETKEYIFRELSSQVTDPESNFEEVRIEPFGLQIICSHIEQKILPFDEDGIIEKDELEKPGKIINGYYLDCIDNLQVQGKEMTEKERSSVRILIEEKLLSNNRRIPLHQETIAQYKDYEVRIETLKALVNARILKIDYDAYG
jgi:hypothetical protein